MPSKASLIRLFQSNSFRYGLLGAFIALLYLPYLFKGGFIIDDWGVIYAARTTDTFWQNFANWFPLFSNRPMAPLLLTVVSRTFWEWEPGYILLNLACWLGALTITSQVLRKQYGHRFAQLFLLFGSMPLIASAVIFSPIMQLTATFSLLLWAFSFYCIERYARGQGRTWAYLGSFLLIFLSLLTYEITMPLFALSALYPALILKNRPRFWAYAKTYILPIVIVIAIDLIFQKVVMPHFMVVYSRFTPNLTPYYMAGIGYFWAKALTYLTGKALLSSFTHLGSASLYPWNTVLLLISGVGLYATLFLGADKERTAISKRFLWLLLIGLFLTYFLYLASNRIALVGGYENRGLSSTWWIVSLLATTGIFFIRKYYLYALTGIVFLAVLIGFTAERDNYIRSYSLQKEIIASVLQLSDQENVPQGAVILGNVPHYLPTDYNQEEVFNNPWDFGEALFIKSNQRIAGGNTLSRDKGVAIKEDGITMDGWWDASFENLWYFDLNQDSGTPPTLTRIHNGEELKAILSTL